MILSSTLSCPNKEQCCGKYKRPACTRLATDHVLMIWLSKTMLLEVRSWFGAGVGLSPIILFKSVVLPAPLGPSKTTIVPTSAAKLIDDRICFLPSVWLRLVICSNAIRELLLQ